MTNSSSEWDVFYMGIFSREKHFAARGVGNVFLNRIGLHVFRLLLSELCYRLRRVWVSRTLPTVLARQFRQNGFVFVPDVLAPAAFSQLQGYCRELAAKTELTTPLPQNNVSGFGQKQLHNWGFDRFDGSTLNRFYYLDLHDVSVRQMFFSVPFRQWLAAITAVPVRPERAMLYQTQQGTEGQNPDNQKQWHRDTFQSAFKCWYFTEKVNAEDGPFVYWTGSHKLTWKRLCWEYRQSIKAAILKSGGSFRINEDEIRQMYVTKPVSLPVPPNTLILADVRGFHRRGEAESGARRFAVYLNFRAHPFSVVMNPERLKKLLVRMQEHDRV